MDQWRVVFVPIRVRRYRWQLHFAANEKSHLRWRGEQEGQAEHVTIQRDTFAEVIDGNYQLPIVALAKVIAISDRC
jgi:hypothetical protein